MKSSKITRYLFGSGLLAALLAWPVCAFGQATLDHLLATVNVNGSQTCSKIDIRLNRPVSYLSHFPLDAGTDVTIRVEPLATSLPSTDTANLKEAASVAPGNPANLSSVSFDPSATSGPVIHLAFAKLMAFRVVVDTDSRHLRIDASPPANAKSCLGRNAAESTGAPKSGGSAKTDATPVAQDAASVLKEGKSLLAAGDYGRATAFFTKAVTIGTGRVKQDAQEMLGLSRERAGQLAQARGEYESYLESYPKGTDADRVRERLDNVIAAMENAADKQFAERRATRDKQSPNPVPDEKGKADGSALNGTVSPRLASQPGTLVSNQSTKSNFRQPEADPNAWTWDKNGSIAQYYYRDDNFSSSDPLRGGFDQYGVLQNELLSSGDFYMHGENQNYEIALRTSAYNETGFGEQSDIRSNNIGVAYVEGKLKQQGMSARAGRQSKSTGGVFGRFDGLLLGWEPRKDVKIQAVAGSPVYSRYAMPFADSRNFYGASIDYTAPGDQWAGSLYVIEQDIAKIIDRRAAGAELRFAGKKATLYSAADYDFFYSELNNAYVTGTWNPREGTTLYGTADFRRVPFLLTSNALMGQTETKLSSIEELFGDDGLKQLATDRTATAKTLTAGITQQFSTDWQLSIDATIADYSGTPASGGVDAIPDPGIEYYASAQVTGSNLFKENDVLTMGLRYSDSQTSSMYMADIFERYPISDDLRVSPRLRISVRDAKTTDRTQYLVMPSVAARYRLNKNWNFELEIGARWENDVTATGSSQTLDVLATAGYRYEF